MIITFCGHAQFQGSKEYEQKIFAFLEKKVGNQFADMYFGGYGNFDSFAYVSHDWGGAYTMYRYAKKKGKEIFNLITFEE